VAFLFYLIRLHKVLSFMKNILLLFSCLLLTSSCDTQSYDGCRDIYAVNYESDIDFDDGSCIYTADVVFFYNDTTANELNAGGFDRLDYYIKNSSDTFISQVDWREYPSPSFIYAGKPNCYAPTHITIPIEWYTAEYPSVFENPYTATINYQVYAVTYVDSLSTEIAALVNEDSFDLYANECAAVPITFLNKKKK